MELTSNSAPEIPEREEAIPGIAGELLTAYNAQDLAMRNKQQLIKDTIEEEARENVRVCELERELASLNRRIYCVVEDNKGHEAKCAELWEYLNHSLKTKLEYTQQLNELDQQLLEQKQTYDRYTASMEEYEKNSEIVEKKSSEYKRLVALTAELESIRKEIESNNAAGIDERIDELRKIIVVEQERKIDLQNKRCQLNARIEELENGVASLEREKEIYEKRNQAQLIRMQRQLQETNQSLEKTTEQLNQLTIERDLLLRNTTNS